MLISFIESVVTNESVEDDKGHTLKGPNWKAPAFVTGRKYGVE